jgi:tRNA (guanine37-N1)-methyltransferase
MRVDILTIFPKIFDSYFNESIIKLAQKNKLLEIKAHDIRAYTKDKHNKVDDHPFGGGAGMVMMPQPLFDAIEAVKKQNHGPVIYLSPQGETLTHTRAKRMSKMSEFILICGRYEGIDQRIIDLCVDQQISIGKYVLTGGELGAMVIIDAVSRFIPGILGDDKSHYEETFSRALSGKNTLTTPSPEFLMASKYQKLYYQEIIKKLINGENKTCTKNFFFKNFRRNT